MRMAALKTLLTLLNTQSLRTPEQLFQIFSEAETSPGWKKLEPTISPADFDAALVRAILPRARRLSSARSAS